MPVGGVPLAADGEPLMNMPRPVYDRTSHILIIDDDDILLKFFKIHLNKFFSRIIAVRSAKQVAETLKEKEVDLVISDIYLPGSDGFQIARKVRKMDPTIPILLISGAVLTPKEEMEVKKADGYLRKPFSMDELHNFINEGLQRRKKIKDLLLLFDEKIDISALLKGKIKLEQVVKPEKMKEVTHLLHELESKPAA